MAGRFLLVFQRHIHLHRRVIPAQLPSHEAPLVVLHGLFGSSSNFNTLSRSLNATRSVVLADLRNHGASPWDDDASAEAMAEDIVELLDSLGAERAVLCGHSLGGKVVMAAALAHPERVEQLIVADIAPIEYSMAHEGWRANLTIMEAMGALPEAVLGTRGDADAALRDAGVAEAGIRAFLLQNLVPEERRFRLNLHGLIAAAKAGVLAGWPALLPPAPATLPARLIAGRRSPYCTAAGAREAFDRLFPGAEPQTAWLEAGHWVHAEKPADFSRLVGQPFA